MDNANEKIDYTSQAAHKDFLSWLGSMFDTPNSAHDRKAAQHRAVDTGGAKPFVSGKMSAHDAHEAMDSFWQSVDAEDASLDKEHGQGNERARTAQAAASGEKEGVRDSVRRAKRRVAQAHAHARIGRRYDASHRRHASASTRSPGPSPEGGGRRGHEPRGERGRGRMSTISALSSSSASSVSRSTRSTTQLRTRSTAELASAAQPAATPAASGSVGEQVSFGLPAGSSAAVQMPLHKLTSDESHLTLDGYFSGESRWRTNPVPRNPQPIPETLKK